MWNFEQGSESAELKREFQVEYTLPSACAQALREGSADIGIIPVAAYAGISDLVIVPDVAIAARGAVRSILLVSRKPLEQIESVALDSSSRTSAALTRVLFERFYGRRPRFAETSPELDKMLSRHDGALLIGDLALKVDRNRYVTWDLAEEWRRLTGKPFVFAFWAARKKSAAEEQLRDVARTFQASRDAGVRHVPELAASWSRKLELPAETITDYLTRNIHYHLGAEMIEGMQLFFRYAAELQVLPRDPELRFIRT